MLQICEKRIISNRICFPKVRNARSSTAGRSMSWVAAVPDWWRRMGRGIRYHIILSSFFRSLFHSILIPAAYMMSIVVRSNLFRG